MAAFESRRGRSGHRHELFSGSSGWSPKFYWAGTYCSHAQLLIHPLSRPAGNHRIGRCGSCGPISSAGENAHAGRVEGGGQTPRLPAPCSRSRRRSFSSPAALLVKVMAITRGAACGAASHPGWRAGTGHHRGGAGLLHPPRSPTRSPVRSREHCQSGLNGDAVHQHCGFAAACTGQDQQRAFGGKHRTAPHIVQSAKLFFNIGIRARQIFCSRVLAPYPAVVYSLFITFSQTYKNNISGAFCTKKPQNIPRSGARRSARSRQNKIPPAEPVFHMTGVALCYWPRVTSCNTVTLGWELLLATRK